MKKYLLISLFLPVVLWGCQSNLNRYGEGYEIDGDKVYHYEYEPYPNDSPIAHKIELAGVNPKFFEILNYYYGKNKKNVFYGSKLIEGADSVTFKTSNYFATDKNSIFFQGKKLEGSDPSTFQELSYYWLWGTDYPLRKATSEYYGKDKNFVYYLGKKIANADAPSFQVLTNNYAKDKNLVYWQGDPLEKLDASTFSIVDNNFYYVKDKNGVYQSLSMKQNDIDEFISYGTDFKNLQPVGNDYFMEKLDGVKDPLKFTLIAEANPAKISESEVYWNNKKIEKADAISFELLNFIPEEEPHGLNPSDYAKDKLHVFFKGNIIPEADPNTFKVLYGTYAQDKNGEYEEGKKVN